MIINTISHQISNYTITTPVYEGPLDLLLQLIERAELDITKLALAQVTDQYLEHIHNMTELAVEEVSAFLVIAARLLQIKSEVLLPRPPVREPGEEDLGDALARQLLAYKRYRQIADILAAREEAGLRSYLRLAPPPKVDGIVDLSDISLDDLVQAAQEVFSQAEGKPALSSVVGPKRVTIREKIALITQLLQTQKQATFSSFLTDRKNRLEIVVTFLAVLELVKRHLVYAAQSNVFGDIELESAETWDEEEDFEIEFRD